MLAALIVLNSCCVYFGVFELFTRPREYCPAKDRTTTLCRELIYQGFIRLQLRQKWVLIMDEEC